LAGPRVWNDLPQELCLFPLFMYTYIARSFENLLFCPCWNWERFWVVTLKGAIQIFEWLKYTAALPIFCCKITECANSKSQNTGTTNIQPSNKCFSQIFDLSYKNVHSYTLHDTSDKKKLRMKDIMKYKEIRYNVNKIN